MKVPSHTLDLVSELLRTTPSLISRRCSGPQTTTVSVGSLFKAFVRNWRSDVNLAYMDGLPLRALFEGMLQVFRPEEAKGMDTVIQYDITGEGGGKFYMVIKDQRCSLSEGVAVDPKVMVTVSKDDFYAIAKGELGGAEAFITGKMKVDGRMDDILRLGSIFRQP